MWLLFSPSPPFLLANISYLKKHQLFTTTEGAATLSKTTFSMMTLSKQHDFTTILIMTLIVMTILITFDTIFIITLIVTDFNYK